MASYRFPRTLTLQAWEAELRHGPHAAERAWSGSMSRDQLNLDFSRVEFVDFTVLASALLLLDAAVKLGMPASVTPPAQSVFPVGEPTDERSTLAARRARARGDALAFMRQVGFLDSLRAPHWGRNRVRVLDRAATGVRELVASPEVPEPDPYNAPYRRRRIFPFRWLEPMPTAQLRESDSFVIVSAGLEDLGLSTSDARTLSQTVLTELVENVAAHGGDGSRPPFALVGAILTSAETYKLRQNRMPAHMTEVAERALADGSYVLRVIVAHSGASWAARLAPEYQARDIDTGSVLDRRQETILATLGNRPAASGSVTDGRHGPTGLSWVARVVRSYRGGVQARTADLLTGMLFGRDDDGTRVAVAGLGYMPGTLLELTLPTGPFPPRPRTRWVSRAVPNTPPRLLWVNCAFDPQRGLADTDRMRLADRIRSAHTTQQADGLLVTVSLHGVGHVEIDDRWRGAIYRLLEFASSIARWGTVVLVFPDAEPHILDPCVAAFNEEPTAPDEDAHDAILVVGRHGEPVWCGGSFPLREVLNLLSGKEGPVNTVEARERWGRAGGVPTRFPDMLRANGDLLSATAQHLQLRLSPLVVHEMVAEAVGQQVAEAIGRRGQGVEGGTFRGPTLRLVNRWVHVEELLAGTVGVQLAAFVLARKVETALRMSAPRQTPTAIVRVGSTPRPLAKHFSECLALGGRHYPQQSELNIGEPPIGEQVPLGAKVVLCTDLISTENTVRRAVAMAAGRDADALVIACVVDARDDRGSVKLLNRTIPVVALADAAIGVSRPAGTNVTDIDPLMLRPELRVASVSALEGELDLLTWFATAPDVLRLGHIDDPPRRHYSAFVRLRAMPQQEEHDKIMEAVYSNVRLALADIQAEQDPQAVTDVPMAIWYVASDGNAERLAEIVRDDLISEGFQVSPVTPVPRWTAGDAWAFPTDLRDVSGPVGVLIIHWWAITGSTLLQLIRLAGKSGASWIAAVCMLNQLNPNDADVLRMLRIVSVPAPVADEATGGPSRPSRIPVAIRFVATSGVTAFDAHGCPICATRRRYQLEDEAAPPRLIRHAELLREMLRPRELEEVARDSAADLFTVPITGHEASDYLRWHGLLRRALRTVSGRQEVIDRLRALSAETSPELEWTSHGLIRLLAAEQQWLRLPPLYFGGAADLLSQVCVKSFEKPTSPPWLRVQALMVMSAGVPQHLVAQLPRLLASAGNEAVLIDQMLLDCDRLLFRSPDDSPIDVVQLHQNLLRCRDYVEEQRTEPDATAAEDHLHVIRNLLTIAGYHILSKPSSPQAAWARLREHLVDPVVRHRLEADLLLVRSFVEDIDAVEPSPEAAREASADWDTCVRQLEERALVNLPRLRDILAGDFVSDWLGRRDQRRLLTLARPGVEELRDVTDRLHRLSHGAWRPADPSWQAMRRELLDRINWWNRIFLAAHVPDQQVAALLVELIRSAPVELAPRMTELLNAHRAQAVIGDLRYGGVEIFCPDKLLNQIVSHLLENVRKHRIEGRACRLRVDYMPSGQDAVRMVVRNSGTLPCRPPGRGLKALDDKLKPFGGSLSGQAFTDDDWSFAAIATLPLWHGG
jgi:adenine/guanine phosphoribosyltransferase-like PRPP-binding protein